MEKNIKKNKAGFSLVEVLITLLVLSVGVAAVSALMAGNIKTSINAKNQIIASGLAQEGIELVRNFRDNDSLAFSASVANGTDYRVDPSFSYNTFKTANAAGSDKKLYINASGVYSHTATSATATKFYRKIMISTDPITGDKLVTAIVSWNGTGIPAVCNVGSKCVSMDSTLTKTN